MFQRFGHHRDLHSFPTRRSSDLGADHVGHGQPRRPGGQRRLPPAPRHRHGLPELRALPAPVGVLQHRLRAGEREGRDRKSTRLNSSHMSISYAVFCLKKKTIWITSLVVYVPAIRPPPRSTLFPYTTLFRSWSGSRRARSASAARWSTTSPPGAATSPWSSRTTRSTRTCRCTPTSASRWRTRRSRSEERRVGKEGRSRWSA